MLRRGGNFDAGAVDAAGRGVEQAVVEVLEGPEQVQLERVAGPRHVITGAGAVDTGGAVEAQRAGHTRSVRAEVGAGVDQARVVGGGEGEVPAGQIRQRHLQPVREQSERFVRWHQWRFR